MGNCFVLHKKEEMMVQLMNSDSKILLFPPPLTAHQALSKFPGHAISNELPVRQYLDSEAEMLAGQLYHLVPLKESTVEAGGQHDVVRIKLVVSKQELKELLSNGGVASLDEMTQQLVQGGTSKEDVCCRGWRPALESIPEGINVSH